MQIPASPPDLSIPLIARREVQPVLPVTATPGISEIAEHLDPQVALQWAQPVFKGQSADASRSALEQTVNALLNSKLQRPISAPSASSKPAIEWSTATPGLQALISRAGQADGDNVFPLWPRPLEEASEKIDQATDLVKRLESAYQSLKSSSIFAAQNLAAALLPQPTTASAEEVPNVQQLQQWLASLAPDSESAQQAANLLMTGQMVWQGELSPGIAVRMQREDAWRESATQVGQIEKGASLVVNITLPRLGELKIIGYKWQDMLDVTVQFPSTGKVALMQAWPELEERLQTISVQELQSHWVEKP